MNISTEQIEDIQRLAMPLMKWLHDNCHPHCRLVVESGSVELLEGIAIGKCPSMWEDTSNTLRRIAEPVWAREGSDDGGKTWPHYFPAGVEPEFVDGRLYRSVIPREMIKARRKKLKRNRP